MTKPDGRLASAKSKSLVTGEQQDRPITLDEGLARFASPDKVAEVDSLLRSIKIIDFHLEQTTNRVFDISLHLVVSARAVLFVSTGIVGVVVVALKILAH